MESGSRGPLGTISEGCLLHHQPFFQVAAPFYIPASSTLGFRFLPILTKDDRLFDDSHSSGYEVITHCGFNLHFSNNY